MSVVSCVLCKLFKIYRLKYCWHVWTTPYMCEVAHIIDADTPSYVKATQSWDAMAACATSVKKAKYHLAAEEFHGSFTPLVCGIYREYAAYQKQLTYCLATKWQNHTQSSWVRIQMQFTIAIVLFRYQMQTWLKYQCTNC